MPFSLGFFIGAVPKARETTTLRRSSPGSVAARITKLLPVIREEDRVADHSRWFSSVWLATMRVHVHVELFASLFEHEARFFYSFVGYLELARG
jgi:hypothetical protein